MILNQNNDKRNEIKNQKKQVRESILSIKKSMDPVDKENLDKAICDCLLNTLAYKYSNQILFYASKDEEISTWNSVKKAFEDGKKVLLPKSLLNHKMEFYYLQDLSDLEKGMYQIQEPTGDAIYVPQNGDICIVPAVTYDRFGYRLGYGKGYYDRFLYGFDGVKIGLCYSSLIEKELPRNNYDIKVDILITEKGVYPIQKK